jgi:hypothetical protein
MPKTTDKQPDKANPDRVSKTIESRNGVQRFYSNNVDALWTPHDVSVKFSVLTTIKEATDTSPRIHTYEELAIVTVAWTEAKALALMLKDIVDRYEKLNGEIKIGTIP